MAFARPLKPQWVIRDTQLCAHCNATLNPARKANLAIRTSRAPKCAAPLGHDGRRDSSRVRTGAADVRDDRHDAEAHAFPAPAARHLPTSGPLGRIRGHT
ncbi:hypothetical protein GCM10010182_25140 [Actinomadura cremea]|nr:hypothetical protein GCM10010182_25140 [Actinomadura cremea]